MSKTTHYSFKDSIVGSAIQTIVQQIKDEEIDGIKAVSELLDFQGNKARIEELEKIRQGLEAPRLLIRVKYIREYVTTRLKYLKAKL